LIDKKLPKLVLIAIILMTSTIVFSNSLTSVSATVQQNPSWAGTEPLDDHGNPTTYNYVGLGYPGRGDANGNNITVQNYAGNDYGEVIASCQLESYATTGGEGLTFMQVDIASAFNTNLHGQDQYKIGGVTLEVVRTVSPAQSRITIDQVRSTPGLWCPGTSVTPIPILETVVKTAIGLSVDPLNPYAPYVTYILLATSVVEQLLSMIPCEGPSVGYDSSGNAMQSWATDLLHPDTATQEAHAFCRVAWGANYLQDGSWEHQIVLRATAKLWVGQGRVGPGMYMIWHEYPVTTELTLTYNHSPASPQFTSPLPSASYTYQRGATNKYIDWTATDDNPWYYTVTSDFGEEVRGDWTTSPQTIHFSIPTWYLRTPATYHFTCNLYDKGGHTMASNPVAVNVVAPTLNSFAVIDPADWSIYATSTSVTIGFTVNVNAANFFPSETSLNWVEFTRDGIHTERGHWVSSSGSNNYYQWSSSFAYGNPEAIYTVGAYLTMDGGSHWTGSNAVHIKVQYVPPPPPQPPRPPPGCPYLFVWNGSGYTNEWLLNIHSNSDVVTSQILSTTPQEVNHRYLLCLTEYQTTISHIDQVKLYATLQNGLTIRVPLVSAIHSQLGDVLPQLLFDDGLRVDELGAKWNNGTSQGICLQFLAVPPWLHAVSFTFVIDGHNAMPK
jgi:hypothetical protein